MEGHLNKRGPLDEREVLDRISELLTSGAILATRVRCPEKQHVHSTDNRSYIHVSLLWLNMLQMSLLLEHFDYDLSNKATVSQISFTDCKGAFLDVFNAKECLTFMLGD